MHFPVMPSAKWNGKLVADLAGQCTVLSEAEVMRITRQAAADEAGLLGNQSDMFTIADTTRLWEGKNRFINPAGRPFSCGYSPPYCPSLKAHRRL
jgi:hypothetical protein